MKMVKSVIAVLALILGFSTLAEKLECNLDKVVARPAGKKGPRPGENGGGTDFRAVPNGGGTNLYANPNGTGTGGFLKAAPETEQALPPNPNGVCKGCYASDDSVIEKA